MDKNYFSDKKVLVMGLGRFGGGLDAAAFAHQAGANVRVTDMAPAEKLRDSLSRLREIGDIELSLGTHKNSDFEWADVVVANPAVPPDNEFLKIARLNGALVTSQVNIFFELCPATIIGITGANGKSTTTALTAHLLEKKSQEEQLATKYGRVWLGGNIGNRPLLTTLDQIAAEDLVVLELSSFQLEQLAQIEQAPHVALLTNLTPNHLDRHGTFECYCAAKENIFKFQRSRTGLPPVSIFNSEDEIAAQWCARYSKDSNRICISYSRADVPEQLSSVFMLPGPANLSNLAAAMAVLRHFNVPDSLIGDALPDFKGLPHRLEFVRGVRGIRWYNDSIATTPPSTIAALEAFEEPIVLIAGGYDKKLPFDELGGRIADRAKAVVLMGQTSSKIAQAIAAGQANAANRIPVETVASLSDAVKAASILADPGDVVLLSPACASYDMFDNFQQRGSQFAHLVRDIEEKL